MTIRPTVGAAVGLLVVASTLVAGRPIEARAVGGLNTVSVSPGHGRASAPFQVTYAVSPCQGAAGLTIGFSWAGLAPAGQVLGTTTTDGTCRATLSTVPPVNAATHQPPAPGTYQVFGYVALPTGTPAPNTEASSSYTVDVTPTPTPTASATATAKPSASAPGTPAASTPATSARPSAPAASAPASATGASSQPSSATAVTAGKVVAQPTGRPGPWRLTCQLAVGTGALLLAILAAMGFVVATALRRRRNPATAGRGKDRAA